MLWVALFYGAIAAVIFILFPKIFVGIGSFFAQKVENLTTIKKEPESGPDPYYPNHTGSESAAARVSNNDEEEETCRKISEKSNTNSGEN